MIGLELGNLPDFHDIAKFQADTPRTLAFFVQCLCADRMRDSHVFWNTAYEFWILHVE